MSFFTSLLLFGILLTAVQYLLGESTLLAKPRGWLPTSIQYLVACPACCGTWLGVGVGLIPDGAAMWKSAIEVYAPWVPASTPAWIISALAAMSLVPIGRGFMALGWAASTLPDAHDHDSSSTLETTPP